MNCSIGTVNIPVTQVAEAEVNNRSMKDIGAWREMGKASNNAPMSMVQKIAKRITRPAEKCAKRELLIKEILLVIAIGRLNTVQFDQ